MGKLLCYNVLLSEQQFINQYCGSYFKKTSQPHQPVVFFGHLDVEAEQNLQINHNFSQFDHETPWGSINFGPLPSSGHGFVMTDHHPTYMQQHRFGK